MKVVVIHGWITIYPKGQEFGTSPARGSVSGSFRSLQSRCWQSCIIQRLDGGWRTHLRGGNLVPLPGASQHGAVPPETKGDKAGWDTSAVTHHQLGCILLVLSAISGSAWHSLAGAVSAGRRGCWATWRLAFQTLPRDLPSRCVCLGHGGSGYCPHSIG